MNVWYFYCGNGSLYQPSFCDQHMRFQVTCLSIPTVPTLCLKDPQLGNDTIYPNLLLTVVHQSKLPWCWQLKDKKNYPLTINIYLLERIGETIMHLICLKKFLLYYPDMLFIVMHISREREREREKERNIYIYIEIDRQKETVRERESL